ncbi:MAG: hypothetical protein NVSMB42_16760 [Herpetosiphon sp.]
MENGRSVTPAYADVGCQQTPAFMLLDFRAGLDILTHEFMHAIQWSYKLKSGCMYPGPYAWWAEASAEWAGNYVFPNASEENRIASWFLDTPSMPLETKNDRHEYGSFLWPLYLSDYAGKQGDVDVVRRIWDANATMDSLGAVNSAVAGGFDKRWPEFAAFNWNQSPVDKYKQWDGITVQAKATKVPVMPSGAQLFVSQLDQPLPHLSTHYYDFTFPQGGSRYVYFYSLAQDPAFKLQALIKKQGQWQPLVDWTTADNHDWCFDKAAERIDELVLILSNSSWGSNAHDYTGTMGKLTATNIGCSGWHGTATVTNIVHGDHGSFQNVAVTQGIQLKRPPNDANYGTITYNVTAASTVETYGPSGSCHAEKGTRTVQQTDGTVTISLEEPASTYSANGVFNAGTEPTITLQCGNDPVAVTFPLGTLWLWNGGSFLPITDPNHLAGTATSADGSFVGSWDLTADPPE